jgi:MFS family permease
LSLQAVLMQASWVGIRLMIGYRALEEGAPAAILGVIAASFALPALIAALPVGRLADRFGGAVVSFAGILTVVVGTLVLIFTSELWILIATGTIIGLGHLLVAVGQQTFVAHSSTSSTRDNAFGTLTAAASIGQLVGPLVITNVAALSTKANHALPDTTAGLFAAAGCAFLATPVVGALLAVDRGSKASRRHALPAAERSAAKVLTTPGMWRSLVVSGAVLVTVDLIYTFMPVWASNQNISVVAVGWLLALRAAISVLSRLGLTRLVRRFGRKVLLIAAMSAAVLALAALPLLGAYGAIFVMVGLGIGLGLPQPLTMAWVVGLAKQGNHGAALGMRMTANRFAQTTVPFAVGAVAAPMGVAGIFWANAALLAGSILIVAWSDPET